MFRRRFSPFNFGLLKNIINCTLLDRLDYRESSGPHFNTVEALMALVSTF